MSCNCNGLYPSPLIYAIALKRFMIQNIRFEANVISVGFIPPYIQVETLVDCAIVLGERYFDFVSRFCFEFGCRVALVYGDFKIIVASDQG